MWASAPRAKKGDDDDLEGLAVRTPSFTEADFNDPDLLAELQELAGLNSPAPKPLAAVTKPTASAKVPPTKARPSPIPHDDENIEAVLLSVANLSIDVQHTEFTDHDMSDPELLNELSSVLGHATSSQVKHSGDQEDEPLRGELDRTPAISTASPSTELPLLSARLTEYKKAALKCKRENNLPQARALLVVSKKIQEQVDRLHSGLELSPGFEIPSPPEEFLLVSFIASEVPKESPAKPTPPTLKSKSSATARIPSPALKSPAPVATALPPAPIFNVPVAERPSFSHLISTLKAQVDACTGIAAYHLKADQKSKALEFHKLKKKMLLDLESLSALSSVPGSVPPTIAYRSVEFESELLHQDLNMTEMEISFRTVHDLTSVATEFTDILVGFNFDGYQDVGTGGKGETPLNKAIGNLDLNFIKKINIERSKPFQRFLERKKLSLELISVSTQFFVLSKRTVLGKAQLKLDSLLEICEFRQVVPMMNPSNPRNPTGCKVEVRIRLRQPLLKRHIVTKEERWVQIEMNSSLDSNASPPVSEPKPRPPQRDSTAVVPTAQTPVGDNLADTDIEILVLRFKSVDEIVSNQVLEHEFNLVCAEIEKLSSQRQKVPEELEDLKNSYQIKMNLLVAMVQTGALTMEKYVSQVEESIEWTKKMALSFKKAGRIDEARKAMIRVKLMTQEVEETRQAD